MNTRIIICKDCKCEYLAPQAGKTLRCRECAKENTLRLQKKRMARFFPVCRKHSRWIAEYLLTPPEYMMDKAMANRETRERKRWERLKKRLNELVSPCDDCQYNLKCTEKLLACSAFLQWTEYPKKKLPERRNPTRGKYRIMFPNEEGKE